MSNQVNYTVGQNVTTTIRNWSIGKSGVKQTKYVKVTFNNYISWTGWITDKAMEQTMKTLAVMGYKGSKLSDLQYDNALDIDVEYIAVIDSIREYQGKNYYDASFINSINESGFDKNSSRFLNEFDIDTRAYITPGPAKEPTSNEQNFSSASNAGFTTSDIPF